MIPKTTSKIFALLVGEMLLRIRTVFKLLHWWPRLCVCVCVCVCVYVRMILMDIITNTVFHPVSRLTTVSVNASVTCRHSYSGLLDLRAEKSHEKMNELTG